MGNKTFGDLENQELCGAQSVCRNGMQLKPFKRCLWFQAQVSVYHAKKRWGFPEEEEVKDFYTPDFALGSQAKVLDYLKGLT